MRRVIAVRAAVHRQNPLRTRYDPQRETNG